MEDDPFWIKEYHSATMVHPVGLAFLLVLGLATVILPRRYAVIPALILACFVGNAQRFAVFGLDFNFLRCMVVFGFARILLRGETRGFRFIPLDVAVLLWALFSTLVFTAQRGDFGALINRLGYSFDAIGMYFMFRCLLRDWLDVRTVVVSFILISLPILVYFMVERATHRNLFSVFGGVPEITRIRQGRLRCQGAFSHPILAGCFMASFIPLILALWWQGAARKLLCLIGLCASLSIIFLCASSTPVAAVMFGFMACALYPLRNVVGIIRWGVVGVLIALHIVMKAPVWHLVARIDIVGGSTGWHRFNLLDKAIRNWNEWILLGKRSTANWGVFDITNEYVLNAVRGGGLTLAMLLLMLFFGFRHVGRIVRFHDERGDRAGSVFAWALGATLFIHAMSFFSVSYYGQIVLAWHLHLAMIGSVYALTLTREAAQSRARAAARSSVPSRPHPRRAEPFAGARTVFAQRRASP